MDIKRDIQEMHLLHVLSPLIKQLVAETANNVFAINHLTTILNDKQLPVFDESRTVTLDVTAEDVRNAYKLVTINQ
eukprot:8283078-Pyramimonas_sp.AAC.1